MSRTRASLSLALPLLCASAALFVSVPLSAQNLLANPGFDRDLSSWELINDPDETVEFSKEDANGSPSSGSARQKYVGTTVPNFVFSVIFQKVSVVPSAAYRFGAKIRSVQAFPSGNPPRVDLWFLGPDGTTVIEGSEASASITAPGGWMSTATSAVAPANATFALFILFTPGVTGFETSFDDTFLSGPAGGCATAPRNVAIEFRGRTSQCAPGTFSCLQGETIDFSASASRYAFTDCDRFVWDFGDGTRSSERNPSKVFTGTGPFNVNLTVTNPHGSFPAQPVAFEFRPRVIVSNFPNAVVQPAGVGGATTGYTLRNIGGSATQLNLSQSGSFFSHSPTSFTLDPGASQRITITGLPITPGAFEGTSIPSGSGVNPGLAVRVRLLSAAEPVGRVIARPVTPRVDVEASESSTTRGGTASFRNEGTGTLQGILFTDVPWLTFSGIPVIIPPGQTSTFNFNVDRGLRTDEGRPGSLLARVGLRYLDGASGKNDTINAGTTTASTVNVVYTVTPVTTSETLPPLAAGEVALIAPGVAHTQGSVGLFLSDVTLTNLLKAGSLSNVRLFFRGAGSTNTLGSSPLQLPANQPLGFGDIARTLFGSTSGVGTLHLRAADVDDIGLTANVFNSSSPSGTYGTAIPVFRSDRAAETNATIFLTGLRSDATTHTNLYVQEAVGAAATVHIDFLSQNGSVMSGRDEALSPFGLLTLGTSVPSGAVSARITTSTGSTGRVVAYATPVDRASGDTWAVVDWPRHYGYQASTPAVIPVAGALRGANNTYFRTDVAFMNTSDVAGTGTLRFYSRTGEVLDRTINLAAQQSSVLTDVLVSLFGVTGDNVGFLVFTPQTGRFALTSRTYTTVQGQAATFGSGVPTLPQSAGLKLGQRLRIGGLEDASLQTVNALTPGTFRTNIGLLETAGQSVTVRLSLRFSSGDQRTATQAIANSEHTLTPRQFLQINGLSRSMLGSLRDTLGDLTNLQLDVEVLSGSGAVLMFASSVDNGTGDSILRVE